MKWFLQILAHITLFLYLVTLAGAQSLGGRNDDGVEARARNAVAQVRIRNLCVTLYPTGKTVERRSTYPDWVKQLICHYMVADFTSAASRDAYVVEVLNALRANSAGAWRFVNGAPVVHIVTEDPAYVHQPDPEKSAVTKKIKKNSIRRSFRIPASAAIGIHSSLFETPRATRRNTADRRIPKAEDVIQRILVMAIVADLLAGSENAISKKMATSRIKAGLADFKRTVLTAAKVPEIRGQGFGPRPAATLLPETPDNYRPPNLNIGKNVLVRPLGKPIPIDKIQDGETAGLTRSATGLSLKLDTDTLPPKNIESIEPFYKLKKRILVTSLVRTFIVIEVFYGLPLGKKARRVIGLKNKDCTPAITAHENQHVDQFWTGWRNQVVQEIVKDLKGRRFENMKESIVRVFATPKIMTLYGTKMTVTNLDILAGFIFPVGKKSSAKAARKALYTTYRKDRQKGIRKRFLTKVDELSDDFHLSVQVGIDDNCMPVKDPKLARTSFGKLGKSTSEKPKDAKKKRRKLFR